MDYGTIVPQKRLTKKDVLGDHDKPLFYKSNKYVLSRGKVFPSKSAWTRDLPAESLEKQVLPIIDESDFWDDVGSFCILSSNTLDIK